MVDLPTTNNMSDESASVFHQATSINFSILFIEPQSINAADPSLPLLALENVESQEVGQVFQQDISSELPTMVQGRGTEFGFSNFPIPSLNNMQPETRYSSPSNHDTPPPRRKPGRPKKSAQSRVKSRSIINKQRQFHNDNAMRSRARLNTLLNQLWDEVPESLRIRAMGGNPPKRLSRAEKIEAAVSYMRVMQARLRTLGSED
jgi:hypothetical protein